MKGFICKGVWWLPSNKKRAINGELKYDPVNGASLILDHGLVNTALYDPEIILGFADNHIITLVNCFQTSYKFAMGRGNPIKERSCYDVDLVVLNAHFKEKSDLNFKHIFFSFIHLENWIKTSDEFPEIKFPEYSLSLVREKNKSSFPPKVSFEVNPQKVTSYDDLISKIIFPLRNLFSFAMGMPLTVNRMLVEADDCTREFVSKNSKRLKKILVLGKQDSYIDLKFSSRRAFLPFNSLSPYESSFKKWFEVYSSLQPVIDLYLAPIYNAAMYLDNKFLNIAQAVETYHRRFEGGEYVTRDRYGKTTYQKFLEITSALDLDFKDSLNGHLKYLYQYSLRTRLKKIYDKYRENIEVLIPNKKTFCNRVVNTRNYFTHYDEELRQKAASGLELYKLYMQLKFVIEVCILDILDYSEENISKLIKKSVKNRYQILTRNSPPL